MRGIVAAAAFLLIASFSVSHPWSGYDAFAEEQKEKGLIELLGPGLQFIKPFVPIGLEEEGALGEAISIEVFKRYGGEYRDQDLLRYVSLVGTSVARFSDRSDISYHFAILDSGESNAISAPGGYVFVTVGLLRRLRSEAELAGVLGHEIAHISQKHILKTIEEKRKYMGMGQITMTLLNQDPAVLNELIDSVVETLFYTGLEKETEFEADALGTDFISRVGYDPTGLRDFLITLRDIEGGTRSIFYQTHPSTSDRVSRLNSFIQGRYAASSSWRMLEDRYNGKALRPLGVKPTRYKPAEPPVEEREAAVDPEALKKAYGEFVERMYGAILNREPDQDGYNTYMNALINRTMTSEDLVRTLLESPEFKSRDLPNDEYVKVLYRAILGREPDPEGFSFYYSNLNKGKMSREAARENLLRSNEYRSLKR